MPTPAQKQFDRAEKKRKKRAPKERAAQKKEFQDLDKLEAARHATDQVTVLMRDNVSVAMDNLHTARDIEKRSAQLTEESALFSKKAVAVRKAKWWELQKTKMLLCFICLIILAIPTIVLIVKYA